MRKTTTVALSLALALALPLQAAAAPVAAPPGNSQADQYFETIPTSSGGQAPNTTKTPGDAVKEGKLTPATAQALQKQGSAGRAVANIVAQTAPAHVAERHAVDGGSPEHGNGGVGSNVNLSVPGKQGMGLLFPLILAAAAVAAIAYAVSGRQRSVTR